jgi:protein arginine kinase activator
VDTGRVGCASCYTAFYEDLEPVITGIHGNVHHLGKNPTVTDSRTNLRAALQTKRALLRTAVRNEQYEDAAALRDSIQDIERELGLSEQD